MTDTILVTGGLGKLGSAVVHMLREWGISVVVIDDRSRSSRAPDEHTYVGDFADGDLLMEVFRQHEITHVIHMAALISPAESVLVPELYRMTNVTKTRMLIRFLQGAQVRNFIFSSSAAVYGDTPDTVVSEFSELQPASPYALSKWVMERELDQSGMRVISMRYFNPITREPGDDTVVGALLRASRDGTTFHINGDDWGTSDGTPIRDFIDVEDLALAHVQAVHYINVLPPGNHPVNIGSGIATPIGRLSELVGTITGKPVHVEIGPRRKGDIRGAAADISMARRLLNWKPRVPQGASVAREWENLK